VPTTSFAGGVLWVINAYDTVSRLDPLAVP
jgi:hypothetical protein